MDDNSSGAHPYHAGVSDPGTDAASEKAGNTHTENKSRKKHDETKAGKNKKKKKKKNKDSEKPKKQKIRRKVNIEDPDRFKAAVIKDMKDAFWNKRYDDEE